MIKPKRGEKMSNIIKQKPVSQPVKIRVQDGGCKGPKYPKPSKGTQGK